MEILTQPLYQPKFESDYYFDTKSRESYFAKLEVALQNLSIVDGNKQRHKSSGKK
jgi:hypothetical protein